MDNPVTLPELQSALDDLIAETFCPPLEPDDITIMGLHDKAGCTWDTAKKTLKEWQEAGKVEYLGKRRSPSGKKLDAWRMVNGK